MSAMLVAACKGPAGKWMPWTYITAALPMEGYTDRTRGAGKLCHNTCPVH